jgi:hypothetical protein
MCDVRTSNRGAQQGKPMTDRIMIPQIHPAIAGLGGHAGLEHARR